MGLDLQYEVRTGQWANRKGQCSVLTSPAASPWKTSVLEKGSKIDLTGLLLGRLQSNNCGGVQRQSIIIVGRVGTPYCGRQGKAFSRDLIAVPQLH